MLPELLVAEIGSTTTVVNAFGGLASSAPLFLGQGLAPTSVDRGDVNIGLIEAALDLENRTGLKVHTGDKQPSAGEPLPLAIPLFATSSAAGGLKMTVHGLVYDMTVKAAREAALGAGAVIRLVTAGELTGGDLHKLAAVKPNLILLAGGVDYGEKRTVIGNARRLGEFLAAQNLTVPVIYAGNAAAADEAKEIFSAFGLTVYVTENVYPQIDRLNIEPTRRLIQKAFEEHITQAPGMEKIRRLVQGPILPTPGAVMEAALLLSGEISDLLVIDVGGATTDVHSVTDGSEEYQKLLVNPEPRAKRTVEGDLGVYVNAGHVVELAGEDRWKQRFGPDWPKLLKPVPTTPEEVALTEALAEIAIRTAVLRHCGQIRHLYGPTGRFSVTEGKDLTRVKALIGTGGALTRLPGGKALLGRVPAFNRGQELLPAKDTPVLIEADYIMASLGVLSRQYPEAALTLLKKSLGLL